MRKYAWHRFGADSTIDRADRTEASVALPLVIVGFRSTPCSEQSGSSEFFDADCDARGNCECVDAPEAAAAAAAAAAANDAAAASLPAVESASEKRRRLMAEARQQEEDLRGPDG